jgi:cytochrome c oxidase subunit 3
MMSAVDYPSKDHRTPSGTGTVGMWLFLAALTMLFGSSLLGYIVIRTMGGPNTRAGAVHLPRVLWLSTLLVIGASFSLSFALWNVRRERQEAFRRWLMSSLVLGTGFVAVQLPALAVILAQHHQFRAQGVGIYGLLFFLVLLHALHVVGGIVVLVRLVWRGRRNVYDHEHFLPVRHAALYWHFLDLVWIVMFAPFTLVH